MNLLFYLFSHLVSILQKAPMNSLGLLDKHLSSLDKFLSVTPHHHASLYELIQLVIIGAQCWLYIILKGIDEIFSADLNIRKTK